MALSTVDIDKELSRANSSITLKAFWRRFIREYNASLSAPYTGTEWYANDKSGTTGIGDGTTPPTEFDIEALSNSGPTTDITAGVTGSGTCGVANPNLYVGTVIDSATTTGGTQDHWRWDVAITGMDADNTMIFYAPEQETTQSYVASLVGPVDTQDFFSDWGAGVALSAYHHSFGNHTPGTRRGLTAVFVPTTT